MIASNNFRILLERKKGQREQIQKDVDMAVLFIRKQNKKLRKYEQAKEIIREVGKKTQEQLQFHISDITSLALDTVFPNPYTLEIEFVQRRNKTECDIYFVRDGNRVDPISASGGGAVDIASFALRIASWSLSNPHSRNTIILDEPMRFVSENYMEQASHMIKEISQRLGLQFIIITHEPILTTYADKIFEVKQKKGVSIVKSR